MSITTRDVRQPIARKAPISVRRSKTLIAIVFRMPNAPITQATAEITQDITRVTRIWLREPTNSAQGDGGDLGIEGFDPRLEGRDGGWIAGWIRLHDVSGHLTRPIHLPLQVADQHEDRAVFVDAEALKDADDVERLPINLDRVASLFAEIGREDPPEHHAVFVRCVEAAAGLDFNAIEHGTIGLPAVDDHHEQVAILESDHVHQSADDLSGPRQGADLFPQLERHALGKLYRPAAPLHHEVRPLLRIEGEERALEGLGHAHECDDGRHCGGEPGRRQQRAKGPAAEVFGGDR